jgi:hypothetical protein
VQQQSRRVAVAAGAVQQAHGQTQVSRRLASDQEDARELGLRCWIASGRFLVQR